MSFRRRHGVDGDLEGIVVDGEALLEHARSLHHDDASESDHADELVAALVRSAAEILGVQELSADDDLLLHGMDSIKSFQFVSVALGRGLALTARDVLQAGSVRAIVKQMACAPDRQVVESRAAEPNSAVPVGGAGRGPADAGTPGRTSAGVICTIGRASARAAATGRSSTATGFASAGFTSTGFTSAFTSTGFASTSGGETPTCTTASNYAHTLAGRAYALYGFTYANGSGQGMGWWNIFTTTTLKKTGPNYYVIGTCP